MTPQRKLKLLLLQQFLAVAILVLAIMLAAALPNYGPIAALLLLIAASRFAKYIDKPLKNTDVRLTRSQKHIYFGAAVFYFFALVGGVVWFSMMGSVPLGDILWLSLTHSRAPSWVLPVLVVPVLLVILFAQADSIYGSKSQV